MERESLKCFNRLKRGEIGHKTRVYITHFMLSVRQLACRQEAFRVDAGTDVSIIGCQVNALKKYVG